MSKKRTVQLLLIDGTATGRIQAKLDNWTGVAYKIPKILLPESGDRKDRKFCGIYFLLGRDDETDERIAYIGQTSERKSGESLLARVAEHGRSGEKRSSTRSCSSQRERTTSVRRSCASWKTASGTLPRLPAATES